MTNRKTNNVLPSASDNSETIALLDDSQMPAEITPQAIEPGLIIPAPLLTEPLTESAAVFITQIASSLLPQDILMRKILEERAQSIAKPVDQQIQARHDQYLCFRLGEVERYGISYLHLEELLYVGHLARVPCTPSFVAGVINHRGELLTVLDIKQFFCMPSAEPGQEARIIVVKIEGVRAGLLVDGVDSNEEYQDTELSPPISSAGVTNMKYVLGIHRGNVTLLNLQAMMDDPALQVRR